MLSALSLLGLIPGLGLGPTELIIILVIVLVIFGPRKLPQLGKALGDGIKSLRGAAKGVRGDDEEEEEEDSKPKKKKKPAPEPDEDEEEEE